MNNIVTETITEGFHDTSQGIYFKGVYNVCRNKDKGDKKRLRVRIKRDAHDFQSFAVIEVFGNSHWNEVYSLHIEECQCAKAFYQDKAANLKDEVKEYFRKDRDRLIEITEQVIF